MPKEEFIMGMWEIVNASLHTDVLFLNSVGSFYSMQSTIYFCSMQSTIYFCLMQSTICYCTCIMCCNVRSWRERNIIIYIYVWNTCAYIYVIPRIKYTNDAHSTLIKLINLLKGSSIWNNDNKRKSFHCVDRREVLHSLGGEDPCYLCLASYSALCDIK